MQKSFYLIFFSLCLFVFACSDSSKKEELISITTDAPLELRVQMDSLFKTYLQVSNALVRGDSLMVMNKAFYINNQVMDIGQAVTGGKYQTYWLQEGSKLIKVVDAIALAPTLAKQRELYSLLTDQVLIVFKKFGFNNQKVYSMYCPMALDNKGALWLSDTSLLLNPYYGNEMLHCGEIKEVYSFNVMLNGK